MAFMQLPYYMKGETLQQKLLPTTREFKAGSKIDLNSDYIPI